MFDLLLKYVENNILFWKTYGDYSDEENIQKTKKIYVGFILDCRKQTGTSAKSTEKSLSIKTASIFL